MQGSIYLLENYNKKHNTGNSKNNTYTFEKFCHGMLTIVP